MKAKHQLVAFISVIQVGFIAPLSGAQAQGDKAAARAQAQAQMKEVLADYDGGNYQKAMQLCKKMLVAEPKNLTAHYVMGNICVKCNQIEDAKAQYNYCIQSSAGINSSEAAYAKKALEQIRDQNSASAQAYSHAPGEVHRGAMTGSGKSTDEYIQEQTDILTKESKEKIDVKKRTLDDKIKQIQDEMKEQLYGFQPFSGRRVAARAAVTEAQDQLKQEAQHRIEELKNEFERASEEINQSYQSRINGLTEHYHNIQSGSGGRGGSR